MAWKVWGYLEKVLSTDFNANFQFCNDLVPVGAVMLFDDLNGVNAVNSAIWSAMNGQTISDAGSVYNVKTLQDVSGRYICGFGTDGGGDLISSAWSAAAVGNASHQVNLSHAHAVGTLKFKTGENTYLDGIKMYDINGTALRVPNVTPKLNGTGTSHDVWNYSNNHGQWYTKDGFGSTNSSGSATQSVQPRSIRLRAYVRRK
jgi:hypothetical protein